MAFLRVKAARPFRMCESSRVGPRLSIRNIPRRRLVLENDGDGSAWPRGDPLQAFWVVLFITLSFAPLVVLLRKLWP